MTDAHLHSAARAFAAVMAARHPEYVWTPVVRHDGEDPHPTASDSHDVYSPEEKTR